ncbi:alpha/beta hydrolase [Methylonatrum kenyense]|uniref:alpha/beta hydrolase n=1 Tax=Methylonatrum kenyense TaxID=455253 RepID=UPI0020BD864A|nr:alpha/beta fold hydrolase [Methylonatrum kenyense]MCK8515293.1 alpha/beta hydrolase [Methylonatrum kenyense]
MTEKLLDAVEIGDDAARASVIWLHGLGADGNDFRPIVPELRLPASSGVRFIFPHAPEQPVTLNGGMVMRAWYDLISLDRSGRQDEAGIRAAADRVQALIERENKRGVPDERIILAGFSQGGAVALHLGLRHPRRLAGILALSTYLPLPETVAAERSAANAETPIFMAHGAMDPVLELRLGEQSRQELASLGYAVEWHTYPMAHAVCMEEIIAVGEWITATFKV